ncbi:glycine/sarcosine/betaine reductase complex component C subunit beta [Desulfosporosinus sp. SB140]|uniref:glycine/sarcosine/betaine reductase complex component C subunit beta n=1 Tax=Desulfosporosinus paludis TaxID=3115649 RepID=UPI0038910402
MSYPVISKISYFLAHAPQLLMECGSTQMLEKVKNPGGNYLTNLTKSLRTYEQVVSYAPNQVFIGNLNPEDLKSIPKPWYENLLQPKRFGEFGEIMPEQEFFGLMKLVDTFDLVFLAEDFTAELKKDLVKHPLLTDKEIEGLGQGIPLSRIEEMLEQQTAVPLEWKGRTVGCVKQAHDWDPNLSAHVMAENLASKASGVMAAKHLLQESQKAEEVEYIIECSEEASGDMNQRGGGNFAKAIGELCGCTSATGSDIRGFCAAPNHAVIQAAALVKAGVYKCVMVVAGGSVAKLGMNGRDHVNKNVPILEDVIGGFAVLIQPNDGINPIIRTDLIGRHRIRSGASPQAVMQAIVADPLESNNLSLQSIDKYAAEMQNPEITEPAGAGDVPKANYRMIAALAVLKGEIERGAIQQFVDEHGIQGFAPTQGHIPSGVPYLGHARKALLEGRIEKAMIIGKGSLFLGRLTNLFDGVSFVLQRNDGAAEDSELRPANSKAELKLLVAQALRKAVEFLNEADKSGGE